MKKLSILVILLVGLLALVGCSSDDGDSSLTTHTLTVSLQDQAENEVTGNVTIDGTTKTADASVQFDLSNGTYTVAVSADGYEDVSQDVTIDGEDSSVTIELTEVTDNNGTNFDLNNFELWSEGRTSLTMENGAAVLDVSEVGDAFWKTQFYKEGITVPGAGTYVVTFDAKAATPRDMRVEVAPTEAAVAPGQFDFSLTDTMQTYQASFEFSGLGANPVYKLNFELGAISDASVPSTVTIDNVEVKSGSALSESEMTVNVTDGTNALEGAEVAIQQTNTADPVMTDASGDAVFNLEDRQYTVEVSADGYQTASKTVVLAGDKTVDIALEEIQTASGPGYLYLTDESTAPTDATALAYTDYVTWEGQSTVTEITSDSDYNPCLQSVSNDDGGWGNVISFTGIQSGAIASYDTLKFKLKTSDYTNLAVQLAGAETEEQTFTVADGTDLSNGWKQYNIDLAPFGDISSVTEIAVFDADEFAAGKTFLLTDVIFE